MGEKKRLRSIEYQMNIVHQEVLKECTGMMRKHIEDKGKINGENDKDEQDQGGREKDP